MGDGPNIIYDKSLIQGLNGEEAFVLECHYRANIVPILFVEILADLHKTPPKNRTAEDVVRNIASKVSGFGAIPNVHHASLCLANLLGAEIECRGIPIVGGARPIESSDGQRGIFLDEPPEVAALRRWRDGDFYGVERDFAKGWRDSLCNLNLEQIAAAIRPPGKSPLRSLPEIRRAADILVEGQGKRHQTIKLALLMLGVPVAHHTAILARWKAAGGPPLRDFAPYANHVFLVDVFFHLGMASGQISTGRPSHRVDIAYLYYLPFCNVFTSCDKLHAATVPLFLNQEQAFVDGNDLKADLRLLAARYAGLPAEDRAKGAMTYAAYPPRDGNFLTSTLFDRFIPGWRSHAESPIEITPEISRHIMKKIRPMMDAIDDLKRKA